MSVCVSVYVHVCLRDIENYNTIVCACVYVILECMYPSITNPFIHTESLKVRDPVIELQQENDQDELDRLLGMYM